MPSSRSTNPAEGRSRLSFGELVVAAACALLLGLSRWLPPDGFPTFLPGLDTCAFHAATGLPCPGCGLTRAFIALSHGRFHEAWAFHPFAYPLYAACLGGLAYPGLVRWFPGLAGKRPGRILQGLAYGLVAGLMVFGVWRLFYVLHHPSGLWSQA